jgi:hypothetical protein
VGKTVAAGLSARQPDPGGEGDQGNGTGDHQGTQPARSCEAPPASGCWRETERASCAAPRGQTDIGIRMWRPRILLRGGSCEGPRPATLRCRRGQTVYAIKVTALRILLRGGSWVQQARAGGPGGGGRPGGVRWSPGPPRPGRAVPQVLVPKRNGWSPGPPHPLVPRSRAVVWSTLFVSPGPGPGTIAPAAGPVVLCLSHPVPDQGR